MQVKTSELTGAALDWAVAKIEERSTWFYHPSIDWIQGGLIIDRERITVCAPLIRRITVERHAFPVNYWRAMKQRDENENVDHGSGPTALIAAMRCFVNSKLGAVVDIPDELLLDRYGTDSTGPR